jgi:uncharacterized protein
METRCASLKIIRNIQRLVIELMAKIEREPWVDAARALALLGVFLVNGLGYTYSPYYPLQIGPPQPIDSTWANIVGGVVIFLIQGKAWSLLSFLFGYSLCAIALRSRRRGINPINRLYRRYGKLLLLGVLHGFFIYFGDILTIYGLCGLLASHWALAPRTKLVSVWRFFSKIIIAIVVLTMSSGIYSFLYGSYASDSGFDITSANRFGNLSGVQNFFELNSVSYLWQQFDSLFFFLPFVLWCCLAGVLARRYKLLSANAIAKKFWQITVTPWQCFAILMLNFGLGMASFYIHQTDGYSNRILIISSLSAWFGMALSAAFVATGMRYVNATNQIPRWMIWLAPAGRHTLAMYLSLSVLLVLSNSAFANLSRSTLTTLSALVFAWLSAVLMARFATRKNWRDPIARWLSSY